MPPKKYLIYAFKQALGITLLLGIIPTSIALSQDFWEIFYNRANEFTNLNEMLGSLFPTNQTLMSILMYLSIIYCTPIIVLFILKKELGKDFNIPHWLKEFILWFEHALTAIFSIMFVASGIFFTIGLFFCFTSLGISHGLIIVGYGAVLFLLANLSLAIMLEAKDAFLQRFP